MAGRRPDARLVAKNKETGDTAEVGALWENQFGGYNLKPVTEESTSEGGFKKLPLADVCDGRFYLNIYTNKKENEDEFPD